MRPRFHIKQGLLILIGSLFDNKKMKKYIFNLIALTILILFFGFKNKKPLAHSIYSAGDYYETFDSLNAAWEIQRYSFEENGSNMTEENISINNSILTLTTSKISMEIFPNPIMAEK
ncbi:MAG: hypothetical protein JWM14_572 [Chitinophagaceae bacterium]|nr:hypothetical protein [Chitinophagaceae bacterium]